jgi:hypothetical protein
MNDIQKIDLPDKVKNIKIFKKYVELNRKNKEIFLIN